MPLMVVTFPLEGRPIDALSWGGALNFIQCMLTNVHISDDGRLSYTPTFFKATTGVRAKLPSQDPPFPTSTHVVGTLEKKMYIGINGDEFPITWGADGKQYVTFPSLFTLLFVNSRR